MTAPWYTWTRLISVGATLAYLAASAFWAIATAAWLVLLENPPPGWRRDDDAWQHDAIVWGNGLAAVLALVGLVAALVAPRPALWAAAPVALALIVQIIVFAIMQTGNLPV